MNEEQFGKLEAMAWITRARMDVLERIIVDFLLVKHPEMAVVLEDFLRHAHEHVAPPEGDDPMLHDKHRLANEAAVRLSDLLAQGLAKKG